MINNPNLPTVLFEHCITTENDDLETIKCSKDVIYFIKNYVKVNIVNECRSLDLNESQIQNIKHILNQKYSSVHFEDVFTKQIAISAFITWFLIFKPNTRISLCSLEKTTAINQLNLIKSMYEEVPWFLKPRINRIKKNYFQLGNKSSIIANVLQYTSAVGQNIHLLYLDEFPNLETSVIDKMIHTIIPPMSALPNSKIVMSSTKNLSDIDCKMWDKHKINS